jgi:hypothetical protein
VTDEQLPPDEAFDTALSILEEWQGIAEQARGDGTYMTHPGSSLASATSRMAVLLTEQVVLHRPSYDEGAWVCPRCVEVQPVGIVRAEAPCAFARRVFDTLLPGKSEDPAPGGLQMIFQDGAEPYVSYGAAELERMHGLNPAQARVHASSVVRAIAGVRRRVHH